MNINQKIVVCLMGACLVSAAVAAPEETTIVSATNYVQDGLVAQWDGIENAGLGLHDDAATTWVDISSARKGGDFTVNAGDSFTAKALNVCSKPDKKYVTGSLGLTAMTIEVVGMRVSGSSQFRRFDKPGGDTAFESWLGTSGDESGYFLERIGSTRLKTVKVSNGTRYNLITRYAVGSSHSFTTIDSNGTITYGKPTKNASSLFREKRLIARGLSSCPGERRFSPLRQNRARV